VTDQTDTPAVRPVPMILELSRYNEMIDHRKAVASGVQEALLCAGIGQMADPYFVFNWQEFGALGAKVGAYWEFSPLVDWDVAVRCFLAQLYAVKYDPDKNTCWVGAEIESTRSAAGYSEDMRLFTLSIHNAQAPNVGIYTRKEWWERVFGHFGDWGKNYPLWCAFYNTIVATPQFPSAWANRGWEYWQYLKMVSTVPGIKGEITFNRKQL
jgi:GH25 family lysozyme M1 (1,4-beta-N-acetylmuramidase)